MRACGEKGGGCGKVCSAAGALFSRRKKVAAVGKFVRLREHCSAAGKRSRLWKDLFSRGSIVQPPEKGRGCGKICSAAGAFVQPPF